MTGRQRVCRTPSMTANLELIDGPVLHGIAGDYTRWEEASLTGWRQAMELRRNETRHRLAISVDECGLIDVKHRRQSDDSFWTVEDLDELVERAPEIRRQALAAWDVIRGGGAA